jgi:hypothetical protein
MNDMTEPHSFLKCYSFRKCLFFDFYSTLDENHFIQCQNWFFLVQRFIVLRIVYLDDPQNKSYEY